jgi:chromosome segregation ATPase
MQIEALKSELERSEKNAKDSETRLVRVRGEADMATKELADERGKVENLGNRVAQLERQLVAQTTEAEILGRRLQDLDARLAEQGRHLVEREDAVAQLRGELDAAHKAGSDLRTEIASTDGSHREAAEAIRADNTRLQAELAQIRDERAKLQQDLSAMLRDAEASWASGRADDAQLRERISDIAAEVARLTMALEGPDSPIEAILAAESPKDPGGGDGRPGHNLADRIRALQGRASRLSPAS